MILTNLKTSIKSILPRSLFARSLLILMAPIVITMTLSTYIFFDKHWEKMSQRLALAVSGETAFLAEEVQNIESAEDLEKLTQYSLTHMQLSIKYVPNGIINEERIQYSGRSNIIKEALQRELDSGLRHPYRIVVDVHEKWTQIHVQLQGGVLIVTCPERRLFSSSGYIFLIWMISISVILLIVAILFMRNQIRPIKRLAVAAERFGKGRDIPFYKPEGAREVRQAAHAFLGMRDRINKQIQQRTAMLAGVSHDLRTPLTRMNLQIEMMHGGEDRDALKTDIDEMKRMIDAYLQFAKGEGDEQMERADLGDIISRQEKLFTRDGFVLSIDIQQGKNFEMFLRPIAFERCIGNIISNAKNYADKAWVELKRDDGHYYITVDDDGSGIDSEHYEDVFKPFYREEKSRNSKTGGVGLGLPIAQDIILSLGGEINLDKSPQGGLRVKISLPV